MDQSQPILFPLKEHFRDKNGGLVDRKDLNIGTIHLRRQHALGGEGYPHVPMVKRSQYIRIKNPLHKHFCGMPMVGGRGQKS